MNIDTDLLIVGGGMAADRLLGNLLDLGYDGNIALASAETDVGYNRVLLPSFLAGATDAETLFVTSQKWRRDPKVQVFSGCEISSIDLERRHAFSDQHTFSFSKIVFATGSSVNYPELEGIDLHGVVALRNLSEARALQFLDEQRILVLGGGLLGLEAADALAQRGHSVHVAHRGQHLMNRQIDPISGAKLTEALECKGIEVSCSAHVTKLVGTDRVEQAFFSDRRIENVDIVLVATGVRPQTQLAAEAGLECGHGIRVDHHLCTPRDGVYAVGECADVAGASQSLVEIVNRQADVLARTICHQQHEFVATVCGTHLKVDGLELYAIGETSQASSEDLVIEDKSQGVYRHLFLKEGRFVGSVLLGDTQGARSLAESVGRVVDRNELEHLAFGVAA